MLKILPEVTKLVAELGLNSNLFYSELQVLSFQSSLGQSEGGGLMGFLQETFNGFFYNGAIKQKKKNKIFNIPTHVDNCPGVRVSSIWRITGFVPVHTK